MKTEDLKSLRFPLIALLAAIGAGGFGIYYMHQLLQAEKQKLAQQQRLMNEARTRVQKSGDEKATVVQYLGDYQYLQKIGFAGDEQRINWLDGLRLANQQLQLFGADYQISTQQPYPFASELDPGPLKLNQSVMKVTLKLLHEGDLPRFLGTLAQQGSGIFSVNQCTLSRIETGGSIRYQPNLRAECELAWITAKPPAP
jgi:hypothetical protein